jgi:biopolymer transport protein ExbD
VEAAHLVVTITAEGRCFVADRALDDCDELREHAARAHAENPEIRALIRADRQVAYGGVVHAIDQVKQGGIAKISFGVSLEP